VSPRNWLVRGYLQRLREAVSLAFADRVQAMHFRQDDLVPAPKHDQAGPATRRHAHQTLFPRPDRILFLKWLRMKAVVLRQPRQLDWADVPEPWLTAEHDVLIQVETMFPASGRPALLLR
jgi:hypothetical protein